MVEEVIRIVAYMYNTCKEECALRLSVPCPYLCGYGDGIARDRHHHHHCFARNMNLARTLLGGVMCGGKTGVR